MNADTNQATLGNDSKWSGIKRKIKKVFHWFIAVMVVIAAIFIYCKFFYTYSDGYHAGLLQKFSHKGHVVKTYEGEMILSSISGNMDVTLAYEKFSFSVTDQNLTRKLDTLQGQLVLVHYKQKNGVLFWRGDSEYMVDSVKQVINR